MGIVPVGWVYGLVCFVVKKRRAWEQGGLGTSATLHARHLAMGTWVLACYASAGPIHGQAAVRATCFFTPALAFFRAFSVLV
jgi:hypothetical protein